jgi:hypothetical protein
MIITAFKTPTTSFCIRLQVTTGYLDDEGLYLGWYYQLGGEKLQDPTVSGNVSCTVLCSVIVQLNCCSGNTKIGFQRLLVLNIDVLRRHYKKGNFALWYPILKRGLMP